MSIPLYPDIHVCMEERDATAIKMINKVSASMHEHGLGRTEITQFMSEALSGSYANVKTVCHRFVNFQEGPR
ncbi:hypothetical protein [Aliihoeflea sp. 40Bstr573]|uniref:hypothetical protein n=1 Tax=Aliihoeflea sp. 40Bstr573 TaxID=2696467 RepID=UPI002094CC51|nr:hypothetical protein [Aliihoeflea sp. 40Bstr573]MCO6387476.1 hypothetical protein [Aliihoeflea sp. 40Bstr573]